MRQRAAAAKVPRWSLLRRLLLIAILASIAAWLFCAVVLYMALRGESDRLFDERLRSLAQTVLTFADHELAETRSLDRRDPVHEEVAVTMDARYRFQIWSPDGRLLLRSSAASASAPLAPLLSDGFSDAGTGAEALRVYSTRGRSSPVLIQVGELVSRRETVVPAWGGYMIALFAITILAIGIVSGVLMRGALRTLDESAREMGTRGPAGLAPLRSDAAPRELVPVLDSINALFARVENALTAEQGFAETAAHELRTPLAAVRMQAQVARRSIDPADRDEALQALEASVDRLSHLVDQLLALARAGSRHEVDAGHTPIDLGAIIDELLDEIRPLIDAKSIRLSLALNARRLWGDQVGIAMLLRNLLTNACRHAPAGGEVRVQTTDEPTAVRLTIDDSGPGIAPEDRAAALARFGGAKRRAAGSAGLGLSIVQTVARAHGAELVLADSPLGGLRVELRFPDRAASARASA